jgi:hypothetical protein
LQQKLLHFCFGLIQHSSNTAFNSAPLSTCLNRFISAGWVFWEISGSVPGCEALPAW